MTSSFGLDGVEHAVICHRCGLIAREVCRRTRMCVRCYEQHADRRNISGHTPHPIDLAATPRPEK